jgi:hypothetical protein
MMLSRALVLILVVLFRLVHEVPRAEMLKSVVLIHLVETQYQVSCFQAQLGNVDLINSCNDRGACRDTNRDGAFDELIDCCNDVNNQCEDKEGLDTVNAGCVSYCL